MEGEARMSLFNSFMVLILILKFGDLAKPQQRKAGIGCADGTVEGFEKHPYVAACAGGWVGHVKNATGLCRTGWHVCSSRDKDRLKGISWPEAIGVEGCYAFNAAQDRGLCQDCTDELEKDDLAGVGRSCPHQNYGQSSCITGGRIDASCCVDTRMGIACAYRKGLATGVLCCRDQGVAPVLIQTPPLTVNVYKNGNDSLTCLVSGLPRPTILWYKDKNPILEDNQYLRTLISGRLMITNARATDSGLYRCVAWNIYGNVTTTTQVSVIEPNSGCANGLSEGLQDVNNISACGGFWKGHVRRAKFLCARGWRVCSAHDSSLIRNISWHHAAGLHGCFAYNAATVNGRCSRCHTKNMAGIGKHCSRHQVQGTSCLRSGRIDVYAYESEGNGCVFRRGITTGVLCCRADPYIRRGNKAKSKMALYTCNPPCENRGHCLGQNKCQCAFGYMGPYCQHAICDPPCKPNHVCVAPGRCQCAAGSNCNMPQCSSPCLNGGRCKNGRCHCSHHHYGLTCQFVRSQKHQKDLNRTER